MAKTITPATATDSMVSLKPAKAADGKLVIVRASELAENGTKGVVASGILEGAKPNKFNADKKDYFIRNEDGTLYIVNGTTSLDEQLGQPGLEGMKVRVEYEGKVKTKNGKGYHSFNCFAEKKS